MSAEQVLRLEENKRKASKKLAARKAKQKQMPPPASRGPGTPVRVDANSRTALQDDDAIQTATATVTPVKTKGSPVGSA